MLRALGRASSHLTLTCKTSTPNAMSEFTEPQPASLNSFSLVSIMTVCALECGIMSCGAPDH